MTQPAPLAPIGIAIYVLALVAWCNGQWPQVAAGLLISAGLIVWDLHARHWGRWAWFGALWVLCLWPVSTPVYWAATRGNRDDGRGPLRAATLAPLALVLGAGSWSWIAAALAPPTQETRNVAAELAGVNAPTQEARKAAVIDLLNASPYRAPWWLSNGHAQSFWGPIARSGLEVDYRSERWDTPDGDFVYVKFFDGEPDKPRVLLLHGLEGSANSPYIKGFNLAFHQLGWNVATLEFRFCSGEINRGQRIYHMGETTDCDFVVRRLAEQSSDQPLYLCGFSLGGNVLGKWLGEQGDTVPDTVRGAAIISPPFNPLISAPGFHKILGGFYAWNFLRSLKPKALAKADQFPGVLNKDAIIASHDFYTYDTVVTAALHGFEDATDYWRKVGCHQFLKDIRVPTMLLTSADDPFNPPETIPRDQADASPWLHPQWTERGGHVGFVMGPSPLRPRYWMEEQTVAFFQAYEALRTP